MNHFTTLLAFSLCFGLIIIACSPSKPQQPTPSSVPEISADLEPFLRSYFSTWSAGDMEGYKNHFLSESVIYLIKNGQVIWALPREPFVEGQKRSREESENPGIEIMTSFRADEDRRAATVYAEWELTQGSIKTLGVDRFTLIRDTEWQWKIISLLFYSTGESNAISR